MKKNIIHTTWASDIPIEQEIYKRENEKKKHV